MLFLQYLKTIYMTLYSNFSLHNKYLVKLQYETKAGPKSHSWFLLNQNLGLLGPSPIPNRYCIAIIWKFCIIAHFLATEICDFMKLSFSSQQSFKKEFLFKIHSSYIAPSNAYYKTKKDLRKLGMYGLVKNLGSVAPEFIELCIYLFCITGKNI